MLLAYQEMFYSEANQKRCYHLCTVWLYKYRQLTFISTLQMPLIGTFWPTTTFRQDKYIKNDVMTTAYNDIVTTYFIDVPAPTPWIWGDNIFTDDTVSISSHFPH